MSPREMLAYPLCSTDEVGSIGIMFLHSSSNSQDVWVKDDIEWVHTHLFCQNTIGSGSYLYATLISGGLPLFIEAHHHDGSSMPHHIKGMLNKLCLAFLQRY